MKAYPQELQETITEDVSLQKTFFGHFQVNFLVKADPKELQETITKVFALQKTLFPSCLSEFIGSNVFLVLKNFKKQ